MSATKTTNSANCQFSPFATNYGQSPIAAPKIVAQSAAERTAKTLAHCKGAINIASQEANDRSRSITPRRIGV